MSTVCQIGRWWMNIAQLKTVLTEIISKTDLTPCVVGHRGVGKSASIWQICQENGWRYVSLRLGQMEVGDLVGIPYREGDITKWSRPSWLPADDDPPTLIHCDELNRAQQEDTLQAIFQFVEPAVGNRKRAIHTHTLAKHHKVVVSINPPDGSYQVATLDRALIDRMIMLYVESDYQCWATYAAERSFDKSVRAFLAANSSLLAKAGDAMQIDAEPTERGWEMVSILKKSCRFSNNLAIEVFAGIVGKESAIAFMKWLSDEKGRALTAEEVLTDFEKIRDRAENQREDMHSATMNEIISYLAVEELTDVREQNLVKYCSVLNRDLKFAFVKSLVKMPKVAEGICKDVYDNIIFEAISRISSEA